jgi:flagellar P-ring protein precursor FlgI
MAHPHLRVLAAVLIAASAIGGGPRPAGAARLKDLADVEGVRANALLGYGLVVGLQGTGDSPASLFANRSLAGLLSKLGIVVDPIRVNVTNVAAVMVTTELPPFARIGETLDVTVSSIADCKNLQGGTLLATPLLGVNGEVYVLAQGPLSIGGFAGATNQGDRVQSNHLTVGRVPSGGIVERELALQLRDRESLRLVLRQKDFTTAARLARALNQRLGSELARARDPGTIDLELPPSERGDPVSFVARLEDVEVQPDRGAIVVLNERTGTIVMGAEVRIQAVAVAHGSLSVAVSTRTEVSQPPPFAETGSTVVFDNEEIVVTEPGANLQLVQGVTIAELVRTLNALGATPRDLIAILQAMHAAGAIQAELRLL